MRTRVMALLLVLGVGCGRVVDAREDASPADAMADAPVDAAPLERSCKDIKMRDPSAATGVFPIDPDGATGSNAPFTVYCDMGMDGGGWTLAMSLAIDPTGLTWTNLTPSFTPPTSPSMSSTVVLDHSTIDLAGVRQMMLMGGNRILKFYYPRIGVSFANNYRDLTERAAFRIEGIPNDAPHTGGSRDAAANCGHLNDACTTTDFLAFKNNDPACPRDATNSHSVANCVGNCGSFGNCPGNGQTPPMPTPNCWFYGGTNATLVPSISTCPQTSQAPWAGYAPGTLSGFYTLWVR